MKEKANTKVKVYKINVTEAEISFVIRIKSDSIYGLLATHLS